MFGRGLADFLFQINIFSCIIERFRHSIKILFFIASVVLYFDEIQLVNSYS